MREPDPLTQLRRNPDIVYGRLRKRVDGGLWWEGFWTGIGTAVFLLFFIFVALVTWT